MKWGLIAILFVSSLATTSFAAERKLDVKASCAGRAEPNFFHLDQSGMEDVEMSLQDSVHGPMMRITNDLAVFFKPNDEKNQKSGQFCFIAKDPSRFCSNPSSCSHQPMKPFCTGFQRDDSRGTPAAGQPEDMKAVTLNLGGKQITLQLRKTLDQDQKIKDQKLFVYTAGSQNRLVINPTGTKKDKNVDVKLKVDAVKTGSADQVFGSTISHVKGTVADLQNGEQGMRFERCENPLKKGKKGVHSYEPPKYTKDLIGDCHYVGAQEGLQSEFNSKVCGGDENQHASYTGNASKGTPARRVTAAGFQ